MESPLESEETRRAGPGSCVRAFETCEVMRMVLPLLEGHFGQWDVTVDALPSHTVALSEVTPLLQIGTGFRGIVFRVRGTEFHSFHTGVQD